MRKLIKIILSIFSAIILFVIMVPTIAAILLSSHTIQNYIVDRFATSASDKLGTTVSVDRINIKLFNRVVLSGLYIQDYEGDTLLYAKHLDVGLKGYNFFTGLIRLGDVALDDANFFLAQDSAGVMNLNRIIENLKTDKKKKSGGDFFLRANSLNIKNLHFKYKKYNVPYKSYGVNFADMDISNVDLNLQAIGVYNDSIHAHLKDMSFREKSGFDCNKFVAKRADVSSSGMMLKDLVIEANGSQVNMNFLQFSYDSWSAYKDFIHKVKISASLNNTDINFRTISYFAPSLKDWESEFLVSGDVEGTVSDFGGTLFNTKTKDTDIDIGFRISGLPDVARTNFMFDVRKLATNASDVEFIFEDITRKQLAEGVSSYIERLQKIDIKGKFNGLLKNFAADGTLGTSLGLMKFDAILNPSGKSSAKLKGNVTTERFDLGKMLKIPKMGDVTFAAVLDGMIGDSLILNTDATVSKLIYNDYAYSKIKIKGAVQNKHYKGYVGSSDPNLDFVMNGDFDFNGEIPKYDFDLDLKNVDLHMLNINSRDSLSVLSCNLSANAVGSTLDDVNGSGSVKNLIYRFNADTVRADEIRFLGNNNSRSKMVAVYSDIVDIELHSRLGYNDMFKYFQNTLSKYLPALSDREVALIAQQSKEINVGDNSADNYYIFKVDVKEPNRFAGAIVPGLYVADGTKISFLFNPIIDNFSLTLNSDYIEYKNMYITNLNLASRNVSDSISVFMRTGELGIGNMYMPDFSILGGVKENKINLGFGFANKTNKSSALINTTSTITYNKETDDRELELRFNTSQFSVDNQSWRVVSPRILFAKSGIDIERFSLLRAGQELTVKGRVSKEEGDTLHLSMSNFNLTPLTGLIDRYGFNLSGVTNGHADIVSATGERRFAANINFKQILINNKSVPDLFFNSNWDNSTKRMRVSLDTERDNIIKGSYQPEGQKYFVNVNIPTLDLSYLQPFLSGVLSGIEGTADAKLLLTGTGPKPLLNGTIDIPKFSTVVDYTKVKYNMTNGVIDVVNNDLILRRTKVYDEYSGSADLDLALRTNYFSNLTYDIRVLPNKLLALNTTQKDNGLFYGTAYASGSVDIKGDKHAVKMDVIGTTENNSQFFMPLNDNASIAEADFITFEKFSDKPTAPQQLSRREMINQLRNKRKSTSKSDLQINLLINVLPNTEVQLVIDPKIGDVIKANGTGSLNMRIRPSESIFTMFGDYEINEGSYLFTLKNIINKRFTIEQGSTIQWTGDPIDARLDITAIYKVRASLATLDPTAGRQNVPVNCEIMLTDRLSKPTITFDVTVPTADTETQSLLRNILNTQEMKSTQFVWLLATNSFYADNSGANSSFDIGTTTTAVTGIEFLSNQISNWLSSDKYSLNFGYRPKSEVSSDEVNFSYSQELIPNKLLIETEANYNFGNGQSMTNSSDNPLSGDFYATYIFDRLGNFRTKIFTRTIDRFDENQGLQESGIGLYYKQDFNTIGELWKKYFHRKPRQQKSETTQDSDSTKTK